MIKTAFWTLYIIIIVGTLLLIVASWSAHSQVIESFWTPLEKQLILYFLGAAI